MSGGSLLVAVVYMPASHSCPSMAVMPPGMWRGARRVSG